MPAINGRYLINTKHPKAEKKREKLILLCSDLLASICCYTGINSLYGGLKRRFTKKPRRIVLLYHSVRDDVKNKRISVNLKIFREQMKFLKSHVQVFPLDHLLNRLEENVEPNQLHVAITFDDGYMDNYENAYPILKEYNFPATIFLVSDLIGSKDMLAMKQIEEMKQNGITFGCHTVSHAILSELDKKSTKRELVNSKSHLEALLHNKVDFLAYPKGRYNDTTVEVAKNVGYKAAFTTVPDDLRYNGCFTIGRISMRKCRMPVFKTKLTGLYHNSISNLISRKHIQGNKKH